MVSQLSVLQFELLAVFPAVFLHASCINMHAYQDSDHSLRSMASELDSALKLYLAWMPHVASGFDWAPSKHVSACSVSHMRNKV